MRSTFFASLALATTLSLGCGPAEGSCAIDTDCPLGRRCSSEQRCVDRGGSGSDAGARDGGARDAASADGARDASADAASDGGLSPCDGLAATYTVSTITGTCSTIAAGQAILVTRTSGTDSCELGLAASDASAPVLAGTVVVDAAGAFAATMLSVAGDPMNSCTGTFGATGLDVACTQSVTAATCTLALTR